MKPSNTQLPYNVYVAGKNCRNSSYLWHKVDGYCKECCPAGFKETDKQIEDRRNEKGYR